MISIYCAYLAAKAYFFATMPASEAADCWILLPDGTFFGEVFLIHTLIMESTPVKVKMPPRRDGNGLVRRCRADRSADLEDEVKAVGIKAASNSCAEA